MYCTHSFARCLAQKSMYTQMHIILCIFFISHQITFLAILFLSLVCSSILFYSILFSVYAKVFVAWILCFFFRVLLLYFLSFVRAGECEKMQGGAIYTAQHCTVRHNTNEQTIYILYSIFVHNHILQFVRKFSFIFFFIFFFSFNLVFSRSVSLSLFVSRSFVFCVLACAKAITICMLLPKCARHEHAFGYRNAQRDRENAEHQTYTIENAEIVSATPNAKTFYTHATREKNNK